MYKMYSKFRHCKDHLRLLIRFTSNTGTNTENVAPQFVTNLSEEETYKILEIFNTSTPNDFLKFKLNECQINKLIDWRESKGPFNSFNDILEVDGLKEGTLKKLCTQIATNELGRTKQSNESKVPLKKLLTPSLNNHILNNLNSVTSIQLHLSGFSWAKLEKNNNNLAEWNYDDFYPLALKMSSADVFALAMDILKKIPKADIYIFENPVNISFNKNNRPAQIVPYNKKMELTSMLLCLLNTSQSHNNIIPSNNTMDKTQTKINNNVFFLKTGLSARAFKLKVGTENVSGISTIDEILNNSSTLPCSPLLVHSSIKTVFTKSISKKQDLLAQSLMVGIVFMELFVYKNIKYYELLKVDGSGII